MTLTRASTSTLNPLSPPFPPSPSPSPASTSSSAVPGPLTIDLTALRAAALNSKKRKAAEARSGPGKRVKKAVNVDKPGENAEGEMEEGEIGEVEEEGEDEVPLAPVEQQASEPAQIEQVKVEPVPEPGDDDGMVVDEPSPLPQEPSPSAPLPQELSYPSPPLLPTPFQPPPPPRNPVVHAIREEAKHIIGELLTYGVPSEYILSIGVSQDIVTIAFNELGFRLPPALAHLAPPPPPHFLHPAQVIGRTVRPAVNPHFNPSRLSQSAEPSPHPQPPTELRPPPRIYNTSPPPADLRPSPARLAEIELAKRKELFARKDALAHRNLEHAQSLESELSALFSAPPPPAPGHDHAHDYEGMDAHAVQHAREAVDKLEELVDVEPSTSASRPMSRSNSHAPATNGRRPVAADFEASARVAPRRPGQPYLSNESTRPSKIVIDLSESESSDEEDVDDVQAMMALRKNHLVQSNVANGAHGEVVPLKRSPTLAPASAPAPLGVLLGKKKLEEKEMEIKRIQERIQRMEKKKSLSLASGTSTPRLGAPLLVDSTAYLSPLSTPTLEQASELKTVEQARERVEELLQERTSIIAETSALEAAVKQEAPGAEVAEEEVEMDGDEGEELRVHTAVVNDVPPTDEASPATATELPPASTAPSISRFFKAYQSPFQRFPSFRAQPLPSPTTSTELASTNPMEEGTTSSAALRAFVARRRGLDALKRVCKFETQSGSCSDASCKSNHFAAFEPSDDDITSFVAANVRLPVGASADKQDVFARGLELVLGRLRPLTLDKALSVGLAYHRECLSTAFS